MIYASITEVAHTKKYTKNAEDDSDGCIMICLSTQQIWHQIMKFDSQNSTKGPQNQCWWTAHWKVQMQRTRQNYNIHGLLAYGEFI